MSNVNESCGCDTNYFSVISNSPLLSGNQENDFNPSIVNDINNSFTNNISDNNIEMNSINNNAMNNAMNSMNVMNNNVMNNNAMNNNAMNNNAMNNNTVNTNQVINKPNINNLGRNNPNLEAIDYGAMRNTNTPMNNAVNFNNYDNDLVEESSMKKLLTHFSFALVVIVALAWNDVAKFYINRSIKFQGGNHRYYVYYAVIATMLVAVAVKGVSKLN